MFLCSQIRRSPPVWLLMPLRSPSPACAPGNEALVVKSPRRARSSLSRSSTPRPISESAEVEKHNDSRGEAPKSQISQPSSGNSNILDELVSWRKLKEPLERYLEFVRCNHFGSADHPASSQQHEDDTGATSTEDCVVSVSIGEIQRDSERLLQRPRAEPCHISSHYHQ